MTDGNSLVGCGSGVSSARSMINGRGVAVGWVVLAGGGVSTLGTGVAAAVATAVGAEADIDLGTVGACVGDDVCPQAATSNNAPNTVKPNKKLRNLMNRC